MAKQARKGSEVKGSKAKGRNGHGESRQAARCAGECQQFNSYYRLFISTRGMGKIINRWNALGFIYLVLLQQQRAGTDMPMFIFNSSYPPQQVWSAVPPLPPSLLSFLLPGVSETALQHWRSLTCPRQDESCPQVVRMRRQRTGRSGLCET